MAELTDSRAVLVHAKDADAASFYRHFDFEPSPFDDLTLMLLIKDISLGLDVHRSRELVLP